MNTNNEVVVSISKKKTALNAAGSCAFVALGIVLLLVDMEALEHLEPFNQTWLIRPFAVIDISFFGICAVVWTKKFFDKKPGLILNSDGIVDNASGVAAGLIPWVDIVRIHEFEITDQKMMIIDVSNPEKYIEACGPVKKWLLKANYKLTGSPINIPAVGLQINLDELLELCDEYFVKYGNKNEVDGPRRKAKSYRRIE